MYVLLNLKDASRLTEVVQLLFSHGHTAVSVAETIEDLCPNCERVGHLPSHCVEQPRREIPEQASVPVADFKPLPTQASSESFFLTPECPLPSGIVLQTPMSSHYMPLSSELADLNGTETSECAMENVKSKERRRRRPASKSTVQSSMAETDLKDDQAGCTQASENISKTVWNEEPQLKSTLTLDYPTSSSTADRGDPKVDPLMGRTGPPSKRMTRIKKFGLEMYQCQLCKKAITRRGQLSNLVNHLSRHSRLHASRKQYCCPVCCASFTRRYLAYSHVKEAHSKYGQIEPLDYGRELREEYHALLEMCFPGTSIRRRRRANDAGPEGSDAANA